MEEVGPDDELEKDEFRGEVRERPVAAPREAAPREEEEEPERGRRRRRRRGRKRPEGDKPREPGQRHLKVEQPLDSDEIELAEEPIDADFEVVEESLTDSPTKGVDEEGEERPRRRRRRRGSGRKKREREPADKSTETASGEADLLDEFEVQPPKKPVKREEHADTREEHADSDEDDVDEEDAGAKGHRHIPSWDDAIGHIISINMESRAKNPHSSSAAPRGRGGRGGRGRGRSSGS